MADLTPREKQAVINSLVTAMMLAGHSLSPTQTKMATRSAGELLWLLNIEKFEAEGRTYVAMPPDGEIVDVAATLAISASTTKDADHG